MGKEKKEKHKKDKKRRRDHDEDEERNREKALKMVGFSSSHFLSLTTRFSTGHLLLLELQAYCWINFVTVEQFRAYFGVNDSWSIKDFTKYRHAESSELFLVGLQAKKVMKNLEKGGAAGHGYTNSENPFRDAKVSERFVWGKKIEKQLQEGADVRDLTSKAERKRQEERLVCPSTSMNNIKTSTMTCINHLRDGNSL